MPLHFHCAIWGAAGGVGYPTYSLKDDERLRREVIAALADTGVKISLGEDC